MRRKDKERQGGPGDEQTAPSTAASMITPLDIQQKEFQVSRFGGYRMRDVDEFLDQLTDALTAVLSENERLRAGAGPSLMGTPDLDDVSRQADEIIQRARDEAARILDDARQRSSVTGEGAVAQADRQAVDAFLARERQFLQRLAALVQEHADGMKAMAREVRRRPVAGATAAAAAASPAAEAQAEPSTPQPEPASAAQASEHDDRPSPTSASGDTDADGVVEIAEPRERPANMAAAEPEPTRPMEAVTPPSEEPIVVSEPEPASARRDDDDRDEGLRELFWGEES